MLIIPIYIMIYIIDYKYDIWWYIIYIWLVSGGCMEFDGILMVLPFGKPLSKKDYGQIHNLECKNSLFRWQFSVAMVHYHRVWHFRCDKDDMWWYTIYMYIFIYRWLCGAKSGITEVCEYDWICMSANVGSRPRLVSFSYINTIYI